MGKSQSLRNTVSLSQPVFYIFLLSLPFKRVSPNYSFSPSCFSFIYFNASLGPIYVLQEISVAQCIQIYLQPFSSSKSFLFSSTFSSPYHHIQSSQLQLSILSLNLSYNFIFLFKIEKREVLTFILRFFLPHCVSTLLLFSVWEEQMLLYIFSKVYFCG